MYVHESKTFNGWIDKVGTVGRDPPERKHPLCTEFHDRLLKAVSQSPRCYPLTFRSDSGFQPRNYQPYQRWCQPCLQHVTIIARLHSGSSWPVRFLVMANLQISPLRHMRHPSWTLRQCIQMTVPPLKI